MAADVVKLPELFEQDIVLTGGGGSSVLLDFPAMAGTDWVNTTRLSQVGRPSIDPMSRTGTADYRSHRHFYRYTTHRFGHQRVFRCRRLLRKLPV